MSQFGVTGTASVYNVWTGKTSTGSSVGYTLTPGETELLVVR